MDYDSNLKHLIFHEYHGIQAANPEWNDTLDEWLLSKGWTQKRIDEVFGPREED